MPEPRVTKPVPPPGDTAAHHDDGLSPDTAHESRTHMAEEDEAGERLDRWMVKHWPDLSRSRCKALVEAGELSVDGAVEPNPAAKIRAGATYRLTIPAPAPATPEPQALPLTVIFEDANLIVLDKAAGMPVHPAVGHWRGTLVNALLHHCAGQLSGIGGVERPGIVHRLDKDTSGVMVVAKSDAAHRGLSAQFADHTIERAYRACTRNAPRPRHGRLETRLARSDGDRRKQAVLDPQSEKGKVAVTHYTTLQTFGQEPNQPVGSPQAALVECTLETGRTHQIRAHMAHLGAPLLGDPLYGKGGRALAQQTDRHASDTGRVLREFRRQALHAHRLGFVHPICGETLRFETPPPKDMERLIKFLTLL